MQITYRSQFIICCKVHVQTLHLVYWQITFNPTFNIFLDNNKISVYLPPTSETGYITINNNQSDVVSLIQLILS